MKCESAFTLTASSIIHLLPAYNIFKKDEIILDLFKLNLKLHCILLWAIICPLSCLNHRSWLLIITSCTQYLTHREIHNQGFFREQCIWTLPAVYLNTTCIVSEHYLQCIWTLPAVYLSTTCSVSEHYLQCIWTPPAVKSSVRKFDTMVIDLAWLKLTNVKKS